MYRSSPSGTTALFYDFVQNTEPGLYSQWVAEHRLPTSTRIIELPPDFAPSTNGQAGSDQIASFVARTPWTIGYDEFGYAKVYGNDVAWIQNAAGVWVKPYAANISAALETATLRPDLSQDLRNVYASQNPGAYPISAYSYMVTQCAAAADRPTCKGNFANPGVAETLDGFMRYVACEGQIQMADIGYAPLPPQLSQFIADAIGRMWGRAPETLTRENCANPRFDPGYLFPGGEAPPPLPDPPLAPDEADDPNARRSTTTTTACATTTTAPPTTTTTSTTTTSTTTTTAPDPCATTAATTGGAGRAGDEEAVGGGSDDWRDLDPVAFDRPGHGPDRAMAPPRGPAGARAAGDRRDPARIRAAATAPARRAGPRRASLTPARRPRHRLTSDVASGHRHEREAMTDAPGRTRQSLAGAASVCLETFRARVIASRHGGGTRGLVPPP